MTNTPNNFQNLPPEMQARLAQIMQQAQAVGTAAGLPEQAPNITPAPAPAPAPVPVPAPIVKPPSLMDHVIALRQEVNQLSQQVEAAGRVTEAVGNAVGQMYGMFQEQTTPTNFSTNFQAQGQTNSVEDGEY